MALNGLKAILPGTGAPYAEIRLYGLEEREVRAFSFILVRP